MGMKFIRRYWDETDGIETEEKTRKGLGNNGVESVLA